MMLSLADHAQYSKKQGKCKRTCTISSNHRIKSKLVFIGDYFFRQFIQKCLFHLIIGRNPTFPSFFQNNSEHCAIVRFLFTPGFTFSNSGKNIRKGSIGLFSVIHFYDFYIRYKIKLGMVYLPVNDAHLPNMKMYCNSKKLSGFQQLNRIRVRFKIILLVFPTLQCNSL